LKIEQHNLLTEKPPEYIAERNTQEDNQNYKTYSTNTITKDEVKIKKPNTTTSLCRNVCNLTKGNTLGKKSDDATRLIFQNINSVQPKTTDKWRATIERMHHMKADIVGLAETCINWNKNDIRQRYKKILTKQFKNSNMVTSKIHNKLDTVCLPGGTATVSVNSIVSRNESNIEDDYKMGRWTGNTYQLGDDFKLNVITAYRVIDQTITTRNSMATNSQQHQLLLKRGIEEKPRKQFIKDF
jgi:hypothetical protein